MKGVILTGGNGSRIGETREIYNKHVAQVYDKPAVAYPIATLAAMGCSDVLIIGSPGSVGDIAKYAKDGERFGVDISYKVQATPNGVAGAIWRAESEVRGVFPLMLGDCYYSTPPPVATRPTLYWHEFPTAYEHSVWNPETGAIIEKPRYVSLGNRAIISYFYDEDVFSFIDGMSPAQSGELEIVDIHNFYRMRGADMVEYTGFFADMGTPEGLLRAAGYERTLRRENSAV